jgi:FMS-like tyrosine kinase 1
MFSGEPDECLLSTSSSEQPNWRIKYSSDYKGTNMLICSQDLLCWAFQVAKGMEYLASRKVRKIVSLYNTVVGGNV